MKGRAVIFDLDGTLLDTLQDIGEAMNTSLREHGFPEHPLDAYRYFVGEGVETLVRRALPEGQRGEALVAKLLEIMREEYGRRWHDHSLPFPGVPEMLDRLESRGLPKAVFSNKPHVFTVEMVEEMLGDWSFIAVRGILPGTPRKPDPAVALEISREIKIPPQDILFVGDSDLDMLAARAAGMFGIGVLWGFRDAAELLGAGARALMAHPRELLNFLI
ncbi:MAG TPA: HAD family hydrolase [Firmicutes bacterium]|nr:HAD family hydrolase [Bacillota bacterium]